MLEKFSHRLQLGSNELLQSNREFLIGAKANIISNVRLLQQNKLLQIDGFVKDFRIITRNSINREINTCEINNKRLGKWLNNYFSRKERRLSFLNEKAELVNPQRILERGFAMVTHNGKLIKNSNQLDLGETIKVKLAKGNIESEVTGIED